MLNNKMYLLIIIGLFFSDSLAAEDRVIKNKDVTGVAGLTPQEDIYQLKIFDNNYVLPLYQTQSPNEAYYRPQNPNHDDISKTNLQFQISLKYGLANNLFTDNDGIYVAYNQVANWQAYDTSAYFRDVQYQPQIFWFWQHGDNNQAWQSTSIGSEHQSNGKGGVYERSWNRAYVAFLFSFDDLKISVKPWLRMELSSTDYNPDIEDFMGYGMVRADWYLDDHQISLSLRNLAESGFSKGYEELSWRFPLFKGVKGYLKLQSGFGMTISDYDHFDNAVGIGFAY